MIDDLKDKKIGVLLGGLSAERSISIKTGKAIFNTLIENKYNAAYIDVKDDIVDLLRTINIDIAFIALHGRFGEDGKIQALLEWLKIPYTGSDVLASALAMDKILTKQILMANNIPTPDFFVIEPNDEVKIKKSFKKYVVKPNKEGSSLGMRIVDESGFNQAVIEAREFDNRILVEEYIGARELTVAVIGNKKIEALPIVEIIPKNTFFDYEAKYTAGKTEYKVPAELDSHQETEIKKTAETVCKTINCSGFARVDFLLEKNTDKFYVLEINTVPGMTQTSLVPKAAKAADISFINLIEKVLLWGLER